MRYNSAHLKTLIPVALCIASILTYWSFIYTPPATFIEQHREIPYPKNTSFHQFYQADIATYFSREQLKSLHVNGLDYSLLNHLTQERRNQLESYGVTREKEAFDDAVILFSQNRIVTRSSKQFPLLHYDTPLGYATAIASYEAGIGLVVRFPDVPFTGLFLPMSGDKLRFFSMDEAHRMRDSSYRELCAMFASEPDPSFYQKVAHFLITGDSAILKSLPSAQQQLAVDMIGIAMAEAFQYAQLKRTYYHDLPERVGALRQGLLTLLYTHGGLQLQQQESGGFSVATGDCYYFSQSYMKKQPLIERNEEAVSRAIRKHMESDYRILQSATGHPEETNFFRMIALFIKEPTRYTPTAQASLERIIHNFLLLVGAVNQELSKEQASSLALSAQ